MRTVTFEARKYVWVVLTDQYFVGEYNKLNERNEGLGPCGILKKINDKAYKLKLPSHLRTSDVFNVKHLIPYVNDSSDDKASNSMTEFFQPRENDVDVLAMDYLEKVDQVNRCQNRHN